MKLCHISLIFDPELDVNIAFWKFNSRMLLFHLQYN